MVMAIIAAAIVFSVVVFFHELGHPVGVAWFSGRVTDHFGWMSLLWVAGVLSLALAFFNLIPLPPLDGGQAAILAIEGIAGRDLGYRGRVALSLIGVAALLILMIITTYTDVTRLLG